MSIDRFENKNIIIVCGMHRSGTSAISGILHNFGYSIGRKILPPAPDNPKGFYENKEIIQFNTIILHKLDLDWDSIYSLPPNWRSILDLDKIAEEFYSIIDEEFGDDVNIIIKDPRINILLPIYKAILLPPNTKIVYIYRKPSDVIHSLIKRNNFKPNKCSLLWLIHNSNIIENIDTYANIVIEYDEMVMNPIQEIENIINKLSIKIPFNNKEKNKLIKEFIESNQRSVKNYDGQIHKNLLNCINRIYSDLNNLDTISSKAKNSILKRSKPFLNYHKIYEESSYTNSYFATLILYKNNFPFKRIKQTINLGTNVLDIKIQDREVNRITVIPSNKYSVIKLYPSEYMVEQNSHDCVPLLFNVNYEHGIKYILNPSSYFLYDFADISLDRFKFTFDIISINRNTLDELSNINDEVNNWIKDNIDNSNNKLNQTINENKILTDKINSQDTILITKNQIIYDLESELSISNEELNKTIQSINIEKQNTKELNKINAELAANLKDQNLTNKQLQKDLKKSKKNSTNSKQQIKRTTELEINLKKKEKELSNMANEYKIVKGKLIHLEKVEDDLGTVIAENNAINNELNKLRNENALLNGQLNQLKRTDERLQSTLEDSSSKAEEITKLKIAQANSNKEIEYSHKEIERLKGDISKQQTQLDELKAKLSENFQEIDIKKTALNNAIIKEHQLQVELQVSNSRTEGLHNVIDDLNNKLGSLENNTKVLREEILNSMNLLTEKNSQLEEANKTHAALEEQIHHIQIAKGHEIEKLNNNQDSQESQVIKTKVEQLEQDLQRRQQDEKAFRDHIAAQKGDIEAIKKSLSYKIGYGLTSPVRWVYDRTFKRKNTWVLGELAMRGLKNPASTIKQINPKNISTLKKALTEEPGQAIVENFEKLITPKSKELVIDDSEELTVNPNRQKILYISPHLPDYDTSSGGKRATRMIALLAEEFDVYIYTKGNMQQKYIDKLHEVGAIVIQSDNIDRIKKRIPKFSSIIYAWYHTITDCKRFIDLYPTAKIIIDSVDVHWIREQRSIGIWEGLTQEMVNSNKRNEIKAYRQADIIWTVTENDKQEVLKEIEGADIRVVSNIHDNEVHTYEDNGKNTMLFIGGFNHYPNISAAKIAAETILPKVRESIPDATLILAGSHAPDDIKELGNIEGVEYRGFIPDEEIVQLYKDSFISIAPLLAGAGIKGKICEAIMFRTPVATNAIGNEGIDLVNIEEGLIAEEPAEIAQLIVKAMNRDIDINQMTHNAQVKLGSLVGSSQVKTAMIKSIMPEISICIVTWNRKDLVERCIQSIEGNTKYPFYKILVHSNGCEDGTQEYLKAASEINKKIVPILSKTNEVFVKPNNAMMLQFPDNDSVLVNNDVYVTEGWLTALYNAAYSSDSIGIAGSKILYPDNTLQEFGSELYADGTGRNIGKWDDPNKPEYKTLKRVGYVSGCSLYIKKSTIDKIGVFDEQFHPCYCEDSDLCYTAWENDIQIVVTPDSIIYHDEGGTSGTDENTGFKAYQKVNFEKFLAKHQKNLGDIADKIKSLN